MSVLDNSPPSPFFVHGKKWNGVFGFLFEKGLALPNYSTNRYLDLASLSLLAARPGLA